MDEEDMFLGIAALMGIMQMWKNRNLNFAKRRGR